MRNKSLGASWPPGVINDRTRRSAQSPEVVGTTAVDVLEHVAELGHVAELDDGDGLPGGRHHVRSVSAGARTRVSPPGRGDTLRLAMVLAFPTIALEQLLHTDRSALATLPLYQALHWLSDSLLALPLAALAVWGAQRLATGLGLGASSPFGLVGRACLISVLFALLLVPGAALHDLVDRLTHVHTGVATHHVPRPLQSPGGLAIVARFVGHALKDGFVGQAIALPLMILALAWEGPTRCSRRVDALQTEEV